MSAQLNESVNPTLAAQCEEAFAKVRLFASEPDRPVAASVRERAHDNPTFDKMYGTSPAMREVYQMIQRVAPTDASVLLIGESGTGKELAATAIHNASKCRDGAFVAINCGAFSDNLIEAELFGYERGAFTGAVRTHRGCFERATAGTLFLDEITEMPIELQIKLLRALETGCFYRVGGEQELSVNVRIIAATNRDPNQAVTQGLLREDLLYRLAVFPLPLPPLRARAGDIKLLGQTFLDELNAASATHKQFTPAASEYLMQHNWPGNVRELKNAVQRAFIMSDQDVEFEQVGNGTTRVIQSVATPNAVEANADGMMQFTVGTRLQNIEKEVILATLEHCRGRKRETAELLGVSLKTLYNRLNEYRASNGGVPYAQQNAAAAVA